MVEYYHIFMVNFGKQKTITDYIYTKPVVIFLVLICIFLSLSVFKRWQMEQEMLDRRVAVEAEQAALEARKNEIEAEVEYLAGERGIEEEMRKNFDVAKEGEQVVILMGDTDETAEVVVPVELEYPWWQFWR